MKILSATKDRFGYHYDIWPDESAVAFTGEFVVGQADVEQARPEPDEEGRTSVTVTVDVYADGVRHFDWGLDVPEATQMREMALLCEPPPQPEPRTLEKLVGATLPPAKR